MPKIHAIFTENPDMLQSIEECPIKVSTKAKKMKITF